MHQPSGFMFVTSMRHTTEKWNLFVATSAIPFKRHFHNPLPICNGSCQVLCHFVEAVVVVLTTNSGVVVVVVGGAISTVEQGVVEATAVVDNMDHHQDLLQIFRLLNWELRPTRQLLLPSRDVATES
jgi:hypothetical protein